MALTRAEPLVQDLVHASVLLERSPRGRATLLAQLAVEVRVEELFLHCGKAFTRSDLWDPATWPKKGTVPSAGKMARSQLGIKTPAKVLDAALRADEKFDRY